MKHPRIPVYLNPALLAAMLITTLVLASCAKHPTPPATTPAATQAEAQPGTATPQTGSGGAAPTGDTGTPGTPSSAENTAPAGTGEFSVRFLNVGKGDAALIRLPGGGWAMVDTGPADGFAALGGMLRKLGITKLDAVFISHPHNDHRGGLDDVLSLVKCPVVYTTHADYGKDTEALNKTASSHGVPLKTMAAGDVVTLRDVTFTAMGPNGHFTANDNDNSLVLRVEWAGSRALFTGDQSFAAEQALLKTGADIRSDILKVGHHGKADASGADFLKAVSPRWALIPTGPDDPPDAGTVQRLRTAGAEIRTAFEGGGAYWDGHTFAALATEALPQLTITEVDVKAEYIEIQNNSGEVATLTGVCLRSVKGNQLYFFPNGTVLPAGGTLRVYSGVGEAPAGALLWSPKKIWHDKKADTAQILDWYGRVVAER